MATGGNDVNFDAQKTRPPLAPPLMPCSPHLEVRAGLEGLEVPDHTRTSGRCCALRRSDAGPAGPAKHRVSAVDVVRQRIETKNAFYPIPGTSSVGKQP